MAGINKVTLVGNLGADPEVRSTGSGDKVVSFRLATSETWKDRSGERQERTEWHNVVIWNENLGGVAEKYLRKGSKIYVEGALQTRKWTDRDGADRYTTEVVLQRFRGELQMLDARGDDGRDDRGRDRGRDDDRGRDRGRSDDRGRDRGRDDDRGRDRGRGDDRRAAPPRDTNGAGRDEPRGGSIAGDGTGRGPSWGNPRQAAADLDDEIPF
jgi:single-strand DNA-binding protein